MSKINLSEIRIDTITEGYLWFSDNPDPISEIENIKEELNQTNDSSNPFIAEGQLYCKDEGISYSIKYVDGEYFVVKYNMAELGDIYNRKSFIANRIKEKEKVYFHQYWKPMPDPFCGNMEVLIPGAFVFVGFNKKEEEI